jgi:hypothetical protein
MYLRIHPPKVFQPLYYYGFLENLTFVSLYGYNSDEPEMFNEIMKNIASYSNTSYLLCGDWNVVQDTSTDQSLNHEQYNLDLS